MESVQTQLKELVKRCHEAGIDAAQLKVVQQHLGVREIKASMISNRLQRTVKVVLALAALCYAINFYHEKLQNNRCLLSVPSAWRYAFRPPEKCQFCANVSHVPKLSAVSSEQFRARYAYSGVPVIVTDATRNWTALNKFDYWYFRKVYHQARRRQKILDCQFLPYKTGFADIYEALEMPRERVEQQPGTEPWYFGWSNCNPETAEIFRRDYGKPYFLPEDSENNAVDWFFIGTAGLGAQMHIDNVRLPSWQAQLSGSKRWVLAPPPECYFQCRSFEVVVEKGDIIVLDTNKWYHQTFVQPGELSLTIGAEYD